MKKKSIENQLYLFVLLGIICAILLSMGISLYTIVKNEKDAMDRNIKQISYMLSFSPVVIETLDSKQPSEEFIQYIDNVISYLDYIDVVTICDKNSIRYYHTRKELIGQTFQGGDESLIVSGASPYFSNNQGSLEKQRRSFHAVYNSNHELTGFVMVSVYTKNIVIVTRRLIILYILIAILLIAFGLLLSSIFKFRIRKLFQGLQPEEFMKMSMDREEVLDALEEGIMAINAEGKVILINDSAKRIFGYQALVAENLNVFDVYPQTKLLRTVTTSTPEHNINLDVNGYTIISNRIPIIEDGKTIGAVAIFRDKTEVTKMAEELTGANCMLDTLRAFNHEFKNKLHVILGLIEIGQPEKASELIRNTSMVSSLAVSEVTMKIKNSAIAALLIGKIIRANELGIHLNLKCDSSCTLTSLPLPNDVYITILGNLIDNAMEELNRFVTRIKEINVGIYIQPDISILSVDDTGHGIPGEYADLIYVQGFSTKGSNRGTGMYLIKDIADRYNGTIELESEPEIGTSFTVTFITDQNNTSQEKQIQRSL